MELAVFSVLLLVVVVVVCSPDSLSGYDGADDEAHYVNEFIVEMSGDVTVADLVAETHNFKLLSHIKGLGDVYRFEHLQTEKRSKRSAQAITAMLMRDPNVKNVIQQKILTREKREIIHDKQLELPIHTYEDKSVYQRFYHENDKVVAKNVIPDGESVNFIDPFFNDQWYLVNTGQTGGPVGLDVNVLPVWRKGITGKDVVVCILDDGVDHTHKDLIKNYDPKASMDLNDRNDKDNDPMPNTTKAGNSHGTRCAGEVAAQANNDMCGVGIAYNSKIGGVRMLDGSVTDSLEAEALLFNNQYIDIFSASWGPRDNGKTMEGPGRYAKQALENGIKYGRNRLGSIFVWATGNGGMNFDTCSCDGYVSSIYTLSVGCIDDSGQSTYFSEVCPSTMAVIYTGGGHLPPSKERSLRPKLKVVTTDLNNGCTLGFEGTSSAAPLAAGCFALVLEANKMLTWRDLQHIVVETAKVTNNETGWLINGAGKHVNHKFGFGALDCGKMVELAQRWESVPAQHICRVPRVEPNKVLGSRRTVNITISTRGCEGDETTYINKLEHVEIHVKLRHSRRGDVLMYLISPSGTKSRILQVRPHDDYTKGINFTFMTVFNWGENPSGHWILQVTDSPPSHESRSNIGYIQSASLTLYGTSSPTREKKTGETKVSAFSPDDRTIKHILNKEQQESKHVKISAGSEPTSINPLLTQNTHTQDDKSHTDPLSPELINELYEVLQRKVSKLSKGDQLLHAARSHIAKKNEIPHVQEYNDDPLESRDLISALLDVQHKSQNSEQKPSLKKNHLTDSDDEQHNSPSAGKTSRNQGRQNRRNMAGITDADMNTLLELADLLSDSENSDIKQRIREIVRKSKR